MPISRRGLTAAGLALATVSALGVTSTLNASAEQVTIQPTAETPGVEAPDAAGTDAPTPPPTLPAEPKADSGPAAKGISKRSVGSGKSIVPKEPVAALEGLPLPAGAKAAKTTAASPSLRTQSAAGASTLALPLSKRPAYFHAHAWQFVVADGTYATLTVGNPELATGESHTLAEVAARSGEEPTDPEKTDTPDAPEVPESARKSGQHTVEVGWRINKKGDSPRLFVFHWVDGKTPIVKACGENATPECAAKACPQGEYNCKFVPHASSDPAIPRVNDALETGVTKQFGIRFFEKNWWVNYDGVWFGYFPGSLWADEKTGVNRFTKVELAQWFGEVTTPTAVPCSEMGTGVKPVQGRSAAAAAINGIGFITGTTDATTTYGVPAANIEIASTSSYYAAFQPTASKPSFRYGGSGASEAARTAAGLPPC